MVHRHNAYVSIRVPVYGGKSPNAYVPEITVEVRAFWPPYLGHEDQVIDLINKAAREAVRNVIMEGPSWIADDHVVRPGGDGE